MAQYEKTGGNILGIFAKFVSSPNNATKQKGKADAFETSDDWGGKTPKAAIWNLQAEESGLHLLETDMITLLRVSGWPEVRSSVKKTRKGKRFEDNDR